MEVGVHMAGRVTTFGLYLPNVKTTDGYDMTPRLIIARFRHVTRTRCDGNLLSLAVPLDLTGKLDYKPRHLPDISFLMEATHVASQVNCVSASCAFYIARSGRVRSLRWPPTMPAIRLLPTMFFNVPALPIKQQPRPGSADSTRPSRGASRQSVAIGKPPAAGSAIACH